MRYIKRQNGRIVKTGRHGVKWRNGKTTRLEGRDFKLVNPVGVGDKMVSDRTGRPATLPGDESKKELINFATMWSIGRTLGRLSIQTASPPFDQPVRKSRDRPTIR